MEPIAVLLEDNTRRAIRRAVAAGTLRAAIVPIASTEQHNEHLAMSHDARAVLWVARKAAEKLYPAVVVTPVVNLGISEHWMDHPGTLTLKPETFTQVVYEVCDSLRRGGIGRILVLNGHGGNHRPMEAKLEEFRRNLPIKLDFCSYWDGYSLEDIKRLLVTGECPGHSAEFETSQALAAFPENVHLTDEPYPEDVRISEPFRVEEDRHYFAGAREATAEKGRVMLEMAADWVAGRMRQLLAD